MRRKANLLSASSCAPGALHVLKHYPDRAEAQAMLDRLEATHGNALEAAATAAPE
jgi:hypothetical protein